MGDAPTFLYRHYDVDGNLLYLGISLSVIKRLYNHTGSPWFSEIRNITITQYPNRIEATKAESKAIFVEMPKYNKQGKLSCPDDPAIYAVYAYLTKKDHAALEKIAVKKKASVSSLVALIIKESISNQSRT